MTTSTKSTVLQVMQDRKSVRIYDDSHTISNEVLTKLLSDATTAPSSSNLQPWRFIVFNNKASQQELRTIAYNQEQVETASAVIAIIGNRDMHKQVERIYNQNVTEGHLSEAQRDMMIENTTKAYTAASDAARTQIATFDTGLIAMQIMLLAKDQGLDTVAMGGFDKAKFHERYELADHEFPAVLLSIGKAAGEAYGSSRIPVEELLTFK